jgi:hypothetical protein
MRALCIRESAQMFLLNNIHDRNYKKFYPDANKVIFDISQKQLSNVKNSPWNDIKQGDIVCVVKGSRKISTFYQVTSKFGLKDNDPEYGETFLLTGEVIAKLENEINMETLLNRLNVEHKYLPDNKFSIGFNVACLSNCFDSVLVKTRSGSVPLGALIEKA